METSDPISNPYATVKVRSTGGSIISLVLGVGMIHPVCVSKVYQEETNASRIIGVR